MPRLPPVMRTVREVFIAIKHMCRCGTYDGRTMTAPQSITSLHASPDAERRSRMVKYSVAMGIRLVCIGACFITPGWWMLIPATGAVLLPYLAVVAANQVNRSSTQSQAYVAPAIVPYRQS